MNGTPWKDLATQFDTSVKTITRTVKHAQERGTFESKPQPGRPRKLDDRTIRYMRRMIKKNPHIAWVALCSSMEGGVSRSTLCKYFGKDF